MAKMTPKQMAAMDANKKGGKPAAGKDAPADKGNMKGGKPNPFAKKK